MTKIETAIKHAESHNLISLDGFVKREIIYCASSLIYNLTRQSEFCSDEIQTILSMVTPMKDLDEGEEYDEAYTEAYEHWIVTDWMAEKLREKEEMILLRDESDLCLDVWGRSTTGQGIALDYVIQEIYAEMINR